MNLPADQTLILIQSNVSINYEEPSEAAIRGVLWKKCSYKFHKIHRKTPVPESLF